MIIMSDIEDLAITGFEEVVKEINYSESSASGYCPRCKKRYIDAAVINGIVQCPNCNN